MKNQIINDIIGFHNPFIIAGPCAVEDYDMMDKIVKYLVEKHITVIRAGAFKPRTSPNDFQGLGTKGLKILNEIRSKFNVKVVSEIVDTKFIDIMCENVDILQVGARNMHNFELLKEIGKIKTPVILKRGMSATIEEFKCAAEYIMVGGNQNIILCERGVRSFDKSTRNLLDLSCVAIIKKETNLPILVDISHSLGRKDIAVEITKAALAVGADGIMVEVHNNPDMALSDPIQQMSIMEFDSYYNELIYQSNSGDVW